MLNLFLPSLFSIFLQNVSTEDWGAIKGIGAAERRDSPRKWKDEGSLNDTSIKVKDPFYSADCNRPIKSFLQNESVSYATQDNETDSCDQLLVSLVLQLGQRVQTIWTTTSPWCGSGSWWAWRTLPLCSAWLETGFGSSPRRLKRRYVLMSCELCHTRGDTSGR